MSIDRRNFVKISALSAFGAMALGSTVNAEAATETPSSSPSAGQRPKTMADEGKPITREEFLQRQENARRYMRDAGLDAIFLAGGTSLHYFTGTDWGNSERLLAMVFPAKGEMGWVSPAFEEARAREQITFGNDLRVWQEDESPYKFVAQILKDRGIATGRLGVEETVKYAFSNGVAQAAPGLTLSSADPVTARCRRIKSAHEIDLMRLANKITWTAFENSLKTLREGMTHHELGATVAAEHQKLGSSGGALVLFGKYAAQPHGTITPQILREGDIVLIDGGCHVQAYESDITRTTVFGKPSDKQLKVWEIVHRAQTTALKTARPGLPCEAVDAAARKVITDAGYGPDYKCFTHRLGHGIGLDGHEWTYLVRGNKTPLEANMSFSDEPGIYIPGEFGIRCEDIMVITESGAEMLTPQAASLEHPYAGA